MIGRYVISHRDTATVWRLRVRAAHPDSDALDLQVEQEVRFPGPGQEQVLATWDLLGGLKLNRSGQGVKASRLCGARRTAWRDSLVGLVAKLLNGGFNSEPGYCCVYTPEED